ncbi:MAG: DUF6484 domain-containing protein [Rhodospirillales bacterium]
MEHVGREAALAFIAGDPQRPIILGLIARPSPPAASVQDEPGADAGAPPPALDARLDGERVVLSAEREIELRCGKARA